MSKVRVYYNSACPVCDAGIGAERRRMDACKVDAEWIAFIAIRNASQRSVQARSSSRWRGRW